MPILLPLFAVFLLVQDPALPPLNQRIVDHVATVQGKKVDRGECWDLAAQALNKVGAKWDGMYGFGRLIDPKQESILPGDILQFEGVTMERRTEGGAERYSFMKHTAVVTAVHGPEEITIAHQNFGPTGRKVSSLRLHLGDLVKGKLLFYRPEA
ncbi:MAG: CHAP domain-containing protein [Flavobacteriales bacterium]